MGRKESNQTNKNLSKEDQKTRFSKPIIALCRSKVLQNAPMEHSAVLLTCIKLPYSFKIFVLSSFKRPLKPGCVAQSVTCLTAETCLGADPGAPSSIPAQSHTFREIDHEIISTAILLPSAESRRLYVSYKRKYVHEVLVTCLVKLAQEKIMVR